jgi:two-component system sensor histidine kinase VicK
LVIFLISALLLSNQQQSKVTQLREQASSLASVLARAPVDQLTSRTSDYGMLNVLRISQNSDEFAYAIVNSAHGDLMNAVTSPGVSVANTPLPEQSSLWPGERTYSMPNTGEKILEVYAPIIDSGELAGNVRIGYLMPQLGFSWNQLPFIGSLALPIFLLTPLFYFLVRREIRPIHAVNKKMSASIDDGTLGTFSVQAGGELREFMDKFNTFMRLSKSRVDALESEKNGLLTDKKLLAYQHTRTESVMQAIPEGLIILGEDGQVAFANAKVGTLLGVDTHEILHKKPTEWCNFPELLDYLCQFDPGTRERCFTETLCLDNPVSTGMKFSVRAYPMFAPEDPETIFGRLIVLNDTTRDVLAEESRSNFVAHVAHEIKTPLNTMSLYAEALRGEQGDDETFRIEAYNVINDEIERLAALVDNLLSITKIEMGSMKIRKQRVRLRDLLQDSFDRLHQTGRGSELDLQLDLPEELSSVTVDKDLFRIALNNLLVNAVKYSDAGDTVSLTAEETTESIQIRVRDTGIGISAGEQSKVFEKFYRSTDKEVQNRAGHGLGLALTKEIVELHRGQVSVASEPGEGSEFVIDLWKDSGTVQQSI